MEEKKEYSHLLVSLSMSLTLTYRDSPIKSSRPGHQQSVTVREAPNMSHSPLLLLLACSPLSLTAPNHHQRAQHHYGVEPKFVDDVEMFSHNVGDKFIMGHADQPDFNEDHTQDHYPQQFSPFQYKQNQAQDQTREKDAFLEAFLASTKFKESSQGQVEVGEKEKLKTEEPAGAVSETVLEPNLREFTLLISKLLFHLSQM